MNKLEIKRILKDNFISCDADECWNDCSDNDKYGYIDVAIVFQLNQETKNLFGELIEDSAEDIGKCWLWAISTSKGNRSTKYYLTGMESAPRINGNTNLSKVIKELFDKKIIQAKKKLFEEIK